MTRYPEFIERLVSRTGLLVTLRPSEPADVSALFAIREVPDAALSGGNAIADPEMFPLVRAGLFYLIDALEESHAIVQTVTHPTASCWHGMIHRREGDFENARYWFRRAGEHPIFAQLHAAAAESSPLMARQHNWDPYLFTGLCEQEKFGAEELRDELLRLQRIEFDGFFDYVWRTSFGLAAD